MIDRRDDGDRALLIHPQFESGNSREGLEEFKELARSAGVEVRGVVRAQRATPDPAFLVGSGKVGEIDAELAASDADLVLFNHPLTPDREWPAAPAPHRGPPRPPRAGASFHLSGKRNQAAGPD